MKIIDVDIEGLKLIEPDVFGDARGYFFESFSEKAYKGFPHFVQDNESSSVRGVVRGLHFQNPPYSQAKLVRCVVGAVLDVALDIRVGSPTYGKYFAVELTEENHRQIFVPKGFAHGFSVLSDVAVFQYKCDEFYHPEAEGGIDVKSVYVDWRIPLEEAILSPKDILHPSFENFISPFVYGKI